MSHTDPGHINPNVASRKHHVPGKFIPSILGYYDISHLSSRPGTLGQALESFVEHYFSITYDAVKEIGYSKDMCSEHVRNSSTQTFSIRFFNRGMEEVITHLLSCTSKTRLRCCPCCECCTPITSWDINREENSIVIMLYFTVPASTETYPPFTTLLLTGDT